MPRPYSMVGTFFSICDTFPRFVLVLSDANTFLGGMKGFAGNLENVTILGIDPGLVNTGYGVISHVGGQTSLVEAGVVRTDPKEELASRLNEIYAGLGSVIKEFQPDLMAVEDLYSHYGHPKTAIIMGHARAMVFLQSAQAGVPIEIYASTKVKSSLTGNGRASKEQVQLMVKSRLNLDRVPSPADAADALAVALCHLHMTGQLNMVIQMA